MSSTLNEVPMCPEPASMIELSALIRDASAKAAARRARSSMARMASSSAAPTYRKQIEAVVVKAAASIYPRAVVRTAGDTGRSPDETRATAEVGTGGIVAPVL